MRSTARAAEIYAFIQFLRDTHNTLRLEAELFGRFLKQCGCSKGRRRVFEPHRFFNGSDDKRLAAYIVYDNLRRRAVVQLDTVNLTALVLVAVIFCAEAFFALYEQRFDSPIFLRLKRADFFLALDYNACSHRLHASGGQSAAHGFP